ncbi:porin [Paraburkholderia sp. 40]|uniref:porin n=1 Tax=Paraburkholderia sp. 40 TaxID=2991059 RepID=UPI003D22EAE7
MKKLACAALFLGASAGNAFAGSVTLYGIMDTGIEYLTNADLKGNSVVRMPINTGTYTSRWGLKGDEGLGNGYKVVFTLENGFTVGNGTIGQGGREFGRQAYVGLSSRYGTLTFGRQWTMTLNALADTELMGPNIYGLAAFDAYLPNARADNSISYKGSFSGLSIGATYSFGRDAVGGCAGQAPGSPSSCRDWSAYAEYAWKSFGVAAGYDAQSGGDPSAATSFFNGAAPIKLSNSSDKDWRAYLSAFARFGNAKVVAGWIHRQVSASTSVTSNIYYGGLSYMLTPSFTLDGQIGRVINTDQQRSASMGVVRILYSLSKATTLYVQAAHLINSGNAQYTVSVGGNNTPAPGKSQTGMMAGIRHFF